MSKKAKVVTAVVGVVAVVAAAVAVLFTKDNDFLDDYEFDDYE